MIGANAISLPIEHPFGVISPTVKSRAPHSHPAGLRRLEQRDTTLYLHKRAVMPWYAKRRTCKIIVQSRHLVRKKQVVHIYVRPDIHPAARPVRYAMPHPAILVPGHWDMKVYSEKGSGQIVSGVEDRAGCVF
jgi:hypothetical protein